MNPLVYRQPLGSHFPMIPYMPPPLHRRDLHDDEEDIASVALKIQKKRFYVDLKRNKRGTFMKIAEVNSDGRKTRILFTMKAALEVKEKLSELVTLLDEIESEKLKDDAEDKSTNDSKSQEGPVTDTVIKSHIIKFSHRRYFLDLKHNKRGYFLRLTMLSALNRIQLAIPSEGMHDLYDAISSLLDKWGDSHMLNGSKATTLPESKSLRVDNKTLYFDLSFNRYGVYLRISEVRTASRTAITIPSRSLSRFRDIINDLADDLSNVKINNEADESPVKETSETDDINPSVNGDIL